MIKYGIDPEELEEKTKSPGGKKLCFEQDECEGCEECDGSVLHPDEPLQQCVSVSGALNADLNSFRYIGLGEFGK